MVKGSEAASAVRPSEAAGVRAEDLVTIGGERVWQLRGTKMDRDFLVPLVGQVGASGSACNLRANGYAEWNSSVPKTPATRSPNHW